MGTLGQYLTEKWKARFSDAKRSGSFRRHLVARVGLTKKTHSFVRGGS